jgi:cell fate regulator YaaT (PSP1 superfamily)
MDDDYSEDEYNENGYNGIDEEEFAALEDRPGEETLEDSVIVQPVETELPPDTPVYRLRLSYSNETFLAAYKGDILDPGGKVMVPTRYGRDLAQVMGRVSCSAPEVALIERPATEEDLRKADLNKNQEKEAFGICREKIEKHRLEMKLVSVHYLLDEPKILFFFTAENRVDFRELVKDLVSVFRTRIELRQIGVRDESRVVGGLGVCGRGYCCHMVSDKLKPVSIKMAKDQNLSLNSMKISGPCGRLLCCLAYEHGFYCEQRKLIPQEGTRLFYDGVSWKVTEVNIAAGRITMNAEDSRILVLPFCRFEKNDNRWTVK